MAFILNFHIGISLSFKVPIFWIPKIQLLVKLCQPMALQAGEGQWLISVIMSHSSQSYLQLGWKFQLCWDVTFWLILVTWELVRGPLICLLKKPIKTHYILLKKSSWDPGKLWGWLFWRLEDLKGYLEVPWGNFVESLKTCLQQEIRRSITS